MSFHLLEYKGLKRVKNVPSLLFHFVLFRPPSGALVPVGPIELSWLLMFSGRTKICPVLLLERPLGLSLQDFKSGLWPGNFCLLTVSLHFGSWLLWI